MSRRWIRLVLVVSVLALATATASAGMAHPRPTSYELVATPPSNPLVFPEGVAFQPLTGHFFVTSTSDGTVYRGDVDKPTATPFLAPGADGRTSAVGIEYDRGRLFVAGGSTGLMFVYNAFTGRLIRSFASGPGGFINDVAVDRDGNAYFTDSFRPTLWRVPASAITSGAGTVGTPEAWANLSDIYTAGFNFNGIEVTPNDKFLIAVQSNTGKLYRFRIADRQRDTITVEGAASVPGDGLELLGHHLFAIVRDAAGNGLIDEIAMSGDFLSARLVSQTGDPSFLVPTTLDTARGRFLVVNSQFGRPPQQPFTVSSVPIP